PVGPPLQIRAHWPQTTVRAGGVQDVTTHAPLRSWQTTAESVYHVQGLGDGDSPTSPIKIQGCCASAPPFCEPPVIAWAQSPGQLRHRHCPCLSSCTNA